MADSATPTYTITHEDGSVVTPQEVYDALLAEMEAANGTE